MESHEGKQYVHSGSSLIYGGCTYECRVIPGYEGKYLALGDGSIFSVGQRPGKLKDHKHPKSEHRRVQLYYKGKHVWVFVHRLVCRAWYGEPTDPGALVLHLDDDPTNNRPENLGWGTVSQNARARTHPKTVAREVRGDIEDSDSSYEADPEYGF